MSEKTVETLNFEMGEMGFTDTLSPAGKKWYATAIMGAVTSDGVIDQDEVEFLKTAMSFLDDPDEMKALLDRATKREVPRLSQLREVPRQVTYRMFLTLAKITIFDGELSASEARYLKTAGRKLGFDDHFCAQLAKFCKNQIVVNKQLSALEKLAFTTEEDYG